jgi:hypothetical protein
VAWGAPSLVYIRADGYNPRRSPHRICTAADGRMPSKRRFCRAIGVRQNWACTQLGTGSKYRPGSGVSRSLLKSMAYRQYICAVAGVFSCVLACFTCQVASATEPRRVLILRYSVGYSDLLARNVRAELEQQSLGDLQIYDALFTTARVADESAIARYGDYLATLFPEQRLDLAVTIGSPAVYFFQRYGRQFFPSTHMLAVAQESRLPSNLGQLETAAAVSLDLVGGVENILKVLPETTNVSVVIGNSPLEQYWLTKARIAFQPFAGR